MSIYQPLETQDLNELRHELALQTMINGRRSSEAQMAFETLFRASCRSGNPLDGLKRHSGNEVERFFAQTVNGTDGHVYWSGAKRFRRNDRRSKSPHRWWWDHINGGTLGPYEDLIASCGEKTCIAPDHQAVGRSQRRQRFTDEQMIGALQVFHIRNGYVPTSHEWTALRCQPTRNVYTQRFGSWESGVRAAGLESPRPLGTSSRTKEQALASMNEAERFLGHPPSSMEFRSTPVRAHLKSMRLPTSPMTIKKLLGPSWDDVLRNYPS